MSLLDRIKAHLPHAPNTSSYDLRQQPDARAPFFARRVPVADAIGHELVKARVAMKNARDDLMVWAVPRDPLRGLPPATAQMFDAIRRPNDMAFESALDSGADINYCHFHTGTTPSHDAARTRYRPASNLVYELLLNRRDQRGQLADLTTVNSKGETPLQTAVKHGNVHFLAAVLRTVINDPSRAVDLGHLNRHGLSSYDQCRSDHARELLNAIAYYKEAAPARQAPVARDTRPDSSIPRQPQLIQRPFHRSFGGPARSSAAMADATIHEPALPPFTMGASQRPSFIRDSLTTAADLDQ